MPKALKIIIIVCASLLSLVAIFYLSIYLVVTYIVEESERLAPQYEGKTIEISDMETLGQYISLDDDLKSSTVNCEVYLTPTDIFLGGVNDYYCSGNLTVTEEYYDELLKKYDDWTLTSKIPQTDDFRYEKQELSEKADAKFNNFIETQKFLYSDKYYNEEKRLVLLSPQENKIYFYIVPIAEVKVLP